jgi:hypothetical protein
MYKCGDIRGDCAILIPRKLGQQSVQFRPKTTPSYNICESCVVISQFDMDVCYMCMKHSTTLKSVRDLHRYECNPTMKGMMFGPPPPSRIDRQHKANICDCCAVNFGYKIHKHCYICGECNASIISTDELKSYRRGDDYPMPIYKTTSKHPKSVFHPRFLQPDEGPEDICESCVVACGYT